MFHARVRLPWNILWRCRVRLVSTVSVERAIETAKPAELEPLWIKLSAEDRATALSQRTKFYKNIRENNLLAAPESLWAVSISSTIPARITRFTDYEFALDLLVMQKQWGALSDMLAEVARRAPAMWEQLFTSMLTTYPPESIPLKTQFEILLISCVEAKINLEQLSRAESIPVVEIVQLLLSKYDTETVMTALEAIWSRNALQASVLASGLLRGIGETIVGMPPSAVDLANKRTQEIGDEENDLPARIWSWKVAHQSATSDNLKIYMLFLICKRRPKRALDLYDSMRELHTVELNEAVLLAASSLGDFERLQAEFEEVERNPLLIEKLGSRRYAIVLEALGFVGNKAILDNIYRTISVWHPKLRTRGVYHALIYSHGLRGDLTSAKKAYDVMVNQVHIRPTMATFSLVLRVYRDALDLPGFIDFWCNEAVDKYEFPLRNQELSTALSLCAKRRDHKSADFLWKWASKLLKPDLRSYNAYLHCLVSANQFDQAWPLFDSMKRRKIIGIDTLTIMMGGAGRQDTAAVCHKILQVQKQLELEPDEGWYVAYLSALSELGNVPRFEAVFSEMKKRGISPHASHYALYTQLLGKSKNFAKNEKVAADMRNQRVPLSFAFIEKYMRMLTAPGTSADSQKAAVDAAFRIVREGYFDPWASMIPRGAIPVRVVEPVVLRLVKQKEIALAKRLLDGLAGQRISEIHLQDDYEYWALRLWVAYSAGDMQSLEPFWTRFLSSLRDVQVLAIPKEQDVDSPKYALPRRYRFNFEKPLRVRMRQLVAEYDSAKLLELPTELENIGVSFDHRCANAYIAALLDIGEPQRAFAMAASAKKKHFPLSRKTVAALTSHADAVNLQEFGKLGKYIQRRTLHET